MFFRGGSNVMLSNISSGLRTGLLGGWIRLGVECGGFCRVRSSHSICNLYVYV